MKGISLKSYYPEYVSLIKLGLPVLVTQVGIIVVSFADTMMVGAYGLNELAAAAFVNSVFMIPTVMQLGFAAGITPLVGALFGAGDHFKAGKIMRAGLQVNSLVSLTITAVMAGLYFFLDKFGQPEELLPLIRNYYLIILTGLFPMAIFNVCQQTANGVTDTSTPMWIILFSNVLNIIGNYLLIFGHCGLPELGLAGAGVSTVISRLAAMLAILLIFALKSRYRIYFEGIKTSGSLSRLRKKVWITSYPVMIQSGIECMLWSVGAVVSGWFGKVQLAAYQVVNTISQLGFMIYMSIGVATSIKVANYTGQSDFTGVRRMTSAGLHLCLLLALIASLAFILSGRHLIGIFTPEESVITSAVALIAPLVLYQFCDATQLIFANALRGTSHVKPLLWISLISYVAVGIPALLSFAKFLNAGNVGVYYSFSVALGVAACLLYRAFRKAVSMESGHE